MYYILNCNRIYTPQYIGIDGSQSTYHDIKQKQLLLQRANEMVIMKYSEYRNIPLEKYKTTSIDYGSTQ